MLAGLGLAIFGAVRLGQSLTPKQRVVFALMFLAGLVWLIFWLINAGLLGRATDASP